MPRGRRRCPVPREHHHRSRAPRAPSSLPRPGSRSPWRMEQPTATTLTSAALTTLPSPRARSSGATIRCCRASLQLPLAVAKHPHSPSRSGASSADPTVSSPDPPPASLDPATRAVDPTTGRRGGSRRRAPKGVSHRRAR
uniref:Uncharacterized protein n=1 Tax=Arundo donax TaxID=35708 RepID=A0A0A8XWU7_ARUDO